MIGSALVQFEGGIATLGFDAHSRFGPKEAICVTGSAGTITASGPVCAAHDVTLHLKRGHAKPKLEGTWFNDGFRGAMGELLCAIEEDREPSNSARENLTSLALCFAATNSADTGQAQIPGKIRRPFVAGKTAIAPTPPSIKLEPAPRDRKTVGLMEPPGASKVKKSGKSWTSDSQPSKKVS
jgi:hypothetical protein